MNPIQKKAKEILKAKEQAKRKQDERKQVLEQKYIAEQLRKRTKEFEEAFSSVLPLLREGGISYKLFFKTPPIASNGFYVTFVGNERSVKMDFRDKERYRFEFTPHVTALELLEAKSAYSNYPAEDLVLYLSKELFENESLLPSSTTSKQKETDWDFIRALCPEFNNSTDLEQLRDSLELIISVSQQKQINEEDRLHKFWQETFEKDPHKLTLYFITTFYKTHLASIKNLLERQSIALTLDAPDLLKLLIECRDSLGVILSPGSSEKDFELFNRLSLTIKKHTS
ncbi:hypothetical protein [Telluribacter sp. SYSU D00476]|uniref:hypothetical protein n=1 Tax=Telluribacter sp. SYSU D00476 TaxID=2811430 RepID=UPI001FF617D3|nr:hypothetical protein [Telluribacter sp. SYSU D00476]